MSITTRNGRPTRESLFKFTTANLALRVTKANEGKRVVSWLNPKRSLKSNISGPGCLSLNFVSVKDKAHLRSSISKAHLVDSYPGDLGMSLHGNQSGYKVGESSRLPMESSMVMASPEVLTGVKQTSPIPDKATKPTNFNPVALHPGRKGDSAASNPAMES